LSYVPRFWGRNPSHPSPRFKRNHPSDPPFHPTTLNPGSPAASQGKKLAARGEPRGQLPLFALLGRCQPAADEPEGLPPSEEARRPADPPCYGQQRTPFHHHSLPSCPIFASSAPISPKRLTGTSPWTA